MSSIYSNFSNIFLSKFLYFHLCVCVCLCICHMCVDAWGGQERTSDSVDLELQVGAGNHIVVPWKSSKHSTAEPFLQSLNFLMRPRFNKTLMITILYSRPKNEQLHRFLGRNQEKGQPRRRPCEQQASAPGQPTQRGLSSKSFEEAWGGEGAELPLLKGSPQRMTPINTCMAGTA